MAKIDDTTADMLKQLMRRVRALETASPIGSSSVTRGALRIASAEGLIVEGSARVSGTLNVTGTETVTGTLNVNGPLNVNGNTTQNGNTAQNGDITVQGAGKITVAGSAPVRLGVADNGFPGLQFPAGNLTADSWSIAMKSGNARVAVSDGIAAMSIGSIGFNVTATGVSVVGALYTSLPDTITGVTSNVYIDPATGRMRRII